MEIFGALFVDFWRILAAAGFVILKALFSDFLSALEPRESIFEPESPHDTSAVENAEKLLGFYGTAAWRGLFYLHVPRLWVPW